jgi:hypothetical protein
MQRLKLILIAMWGSFTVKIAIGFILVLLSTNLYLFSPQFPSSTEAATTIRKFRDFICFYLQSYGDREGEKFVKQSPESGIVD